MDPYYWFIFICGLLAYQSSTKYAQENSGIAISNSDPYAVTDKIESSEESERGDKDPMSTTTVLVPRTPITSPDVTTEKSYSWFTPLAKRNPLSVVNSVLEKVSSSAVAVLKGLKCDMLYAGSADAISSGPNGDVSLKQIDGNDVEVYNAVADNKDDEFKEVSFQQNYEEESRFQLNEKKWVNVEKKASFQLRFYSDETADASSSFPKVREEKSWLSFWFRSHTTGKEKSWFSFWHRSFDNDYYNDENTQDSEDSPLQETLKGIAGKTLDDVMRDTNKNKGIDEIYKVLNTATNSPKPKSKGLNLIEWFDFTKSSDSVEKVATVKKTVDESNEKVNRFRKPKANEKKSDYLKYAGCMLIIYPINYYLGEDFTNGTCQGTSYLFEDKEALISNCYYTISGIEGWNKFPMNLFFWAFLITCMKECVGEIRKWIKPRKVKVKKMGICDKTGLFNTFTTYTQTDVTFKTIKDGVNKNKILREQVIALKKTRDIIDFEADSSATFMDKGDPCGLQSRSMLDSVKDIIFCPNIKSQTLEASNDTVVGDGNKRAAENDLNSQVSKASYDIVCDNSNKNDAENDSNSRVLKASDDNVVSDSNQNAARNDSTIPDLKVSGDHVVNDSNKKAAENDSNSQVLKAYDDPVVAAENNSYSQALKASDYTVVCDSNKNATGNGSNSKVLKTFGDTAVFNSYKSAIENESTVPDINVSGDTVVNDSNKNATGNGSTIPDLKVSGDTVVNDNPINLAESDLNTQELKPDKNGAHKELQKHFRCI